MKKRFHRLTVLDSYMKKRRRYLICKCKCGKTIHTREDKVKSGGTKSCGCYRKEVFHNRTHCRSNTKEHNCWVNIIQRCNNPKSPNFKNYGGRGIKVCKRWKKFENFFEDMGQSKENLSIDRIKVNGNYTKSNCRWATVQQQASNRRKLPAHNRVDMTNLRFGKLICIKQVGMNHDNRLMWECICDCGKKSIKPGSEIRRGNIKSCGKCCHI